MSIAVGDFPVNDKIALVTGGGSGINLAFAQLAVSKGAKVIIVDLKLTNEAEKFVAEHSDSVAFAQTDVTSWKELKDVFFLSLSRFGDVPDIYIAGAGIFDPPALNFWDDAEEERYKEIDINVGHVIKLTRMAMRALVSRGKKGVVLSVASGAGFMGLYNCPLYCATKHAVVGFTKSMAPADRTEGVKIVTVCPGTVDTPLWDGEKRSQFKEHLKHSLKPTQVAEVMLDLVQKKEYRGGTVYDLPAKGQGRVMPLWGAQPSEGAAGVAKMQEADDVSNQPLFSKMHERMVEERKEKWP